jgi:hypothetical protein
MGAGLNSGWSACSARPVLVDEADREGFADIVELDRG